MMAAYGKQKKEVRRQKSEDRRQRWRAVGKAQKA
jgi:hypothetical protein